MHSVGWNSDGKKLASGSFDKSVAIYTLDRERLSKDTTLKGHTGSVDQICWNSINPDLLSTASGDKTVRIWDMRSPSRPTIIPTKGENINITWSPDEKTIGEIVVSLKFKFILIISSLFFSLWQQRRSNYIHRCQNQQNSRRRAIQL